MNKHLIDENILNYCEKYSDDIPKYLQDLERETYITQAQPHMISGHLQGRFLSMISKLINPKYILEIGTYTGYSALCLVEGLQHNGKLITIDCDAEKENICRKYFQQSGMENKLELQIGDAKSIIPNLQIKFDLVFIDADKINYLNYYNLVFPLLNDGAVLLVDNVLFNGDVINENKNKNAHAVHEFNELIKVDERVDKIILPLRDGITMLRKK